MIVSLNAYAATLEPIPPAEIYIRNLIETYASDLATSTRAEMLETLRGESSFDSVATGKLGEVGIAQIYLKYHPTVSEIEARDPVFSVKFMADAFRQGKQRWWSCWVNQYEKMWRTCHIP